MAEKDRMRRRRIARLMIFLAVAGAAVWLGVPRLPDRWNPWAPIDLADPPNFLTGFKLQRLQDEPRLCRAILAGSDFRFTPVADRVTGAGCGFRNAVQLNGTGIAYGGSFVTSCPLAVGLALFERHALQPAARESFGEPVVAIDQLGSYACRNVNNRADGRRSQHATANAIDIAGFRLAGGTTISIDRHWNSGDARAAFLRRAHDGACGIFTVVLGPDYNAAHQNHWHFDLGGFGLCR